MTICILLQFGFTALLEAASNGHPETCEVLLKNNANVNAVTKVIVSILKKVEMCKLVMILPS